MFKKLLLLGAASIATASEVAICSNINGNLTALEAVISDIVRRNIKHVYILGDICGIGPRNDECVSRVRKIQNVSCIAGRWDYHYSGRSQIGSTDPDINWFIEWSKNKVSKDNVDWLNGLNTSILTDSWAGVHGRFDKNAFHSFVQVVADAKLSFNGLASINHRLGFVGLTGVPVAFFDTNPITYSQDGRYEIDTSVGTLINVGSVGGPKDENPDARYVVYNGTVAQTVAVKYDVEAEITVMGKNGFPKKLMDRLRVGQ